MRLCRQVAAAVYPGVVLNTARRPASILPPRHCAMLPSTEMYRQFMGRLPAPPRMATRPNPPVQQVLLTYGVQVLVRHL
jgi:hypothetical protein